MPPDVINLAGGARGEAHTYFYCVLISAKEKKVLFCLGFFLVIVYNTLCRTKHKQNFHLPFTITETGVLGTGCRSSPSSPAQQGGNPKLKEDVRVALQLCSHSPQYARGNKYGQ